MRRSYFLYVLMNFLLLSPCVFATTLLEQSYVGDLADAWANDTIAGSASGYNDGSVMNEGRHWATAEDFTLAGDTQWVIDSFSFACGTDLNAQVSSYRISIYSDDTGKPAEWDNPLFRYEESIGDLNYITVDSTYAGGSKDRYVQQITVNTSNLGIILAGETTYYASIEGNCENPTDVYNGYDTYYQRFYALLGSGTGDNWYAGKYDTGWGEWQTQNGNLILTIEGHEIPEPATLLLFGLGSFMIRRKR